MSIRAIIGHKGDAVFTLSPDATVSEAVSLLATRKIGAAPVVEDGDVVGIVSERDVLYSLERDGAAALGRIVSEVMTAPAMTVDIDTDVVAALGLMTRRRIRHLPVVEDGRMIGFVSIGDLVKHRIDRIEHEAAALREYIAS